MLEAVLAALDKASGRITTTNLRRAHFGVFWHQLGRFT